MFTSTNYGYMHAYQYSAFRRRFVWILMIHLQTGNNIHGWDSIFILFRYFLFFFKITNFLISVSNLVSTRLISTWIQEGYPWKTCQSCFNLHDWWCYPFVLIGLAISLWLSVVSFTLPRLCIQICIVFHFVVFTVMLNMSLKATKLDLPSHIENVF